MECKVGDKVKVNLPNECLCWGKDVNGKVYTVRKVNEYPATTTYLLKDGHGFSYYGEWLVPADDAPFKYSIGEPVRIKSINEILKNYKNGGFHPLDITLAKYYGETHKITDLGHFEEPVYILEGVPGYWSESFLENSEKLYAVSVGWDLSRDLSITEFQFKRILSQAENTGLTTTEVLRMLLAAAMECFLEEGS